MGQRIEGPRRDRQADRPSSRVIDRMTSLYEAGKLTDNQYQAWRAFELTCATAYREPSCISGYGQRVVGMDHDDRCRMTEAMIANDRVNHALDAVGHPATRNLLLQIITTSKTWTQLGMDLFAQPRSTAAAVAIQAAQFGTF